MGKPGWPLRIVVVTVVGACVGGQLRPALAQSPSPDQLVGRMKAHLQAELSNLPNYTCLETVARFHKERAPEPKKLPRLAPLDRILLEVIYSNHREYFDAPGDGASSIADPSKFVGSGMIGNGAFAMTLRNVVDGARITFAGMETAGGRTAARFDYHMLGKSLHLSIPSGVGSVGEEGSLWVDPSSLDVIRVESNAIDIPSYLRLRETSMQVSYARVQLGEANALLPQEADLHMVQTTGEEDYDRMAFTHCRAFSAQSAIRFDSGSDHLTGPARLDDVKTQSRPEAVPGAIPPLLLITLQLTTPITDKDVVGTPIEAKVLGDVLRKRVVIVPNGSLARGRIRRLERYQGRAAADYIVGLEFTEVQTSRGPLSFYADLLRMDKRREIRPSLSEQVFVRSTAGFEATTEEITLPELPGVASFFVRGRGFSVPSGFRTVWRTRGILHQ